MSRARVIRLFLAWNALLIAIWIARFHVRSRDIVAAARLNFPSPDDWGVTLAVNWWSFLSGAAATAGLLALAGTLGRPAARWLRASIKIQIGGLAVFGLGLGLLGTLVLAMGMLGLLFAPPAWAGLPVLTALGVTGFLRHRVELGRLAGQIRLPEMPLILKVALGTLLLVSFLGVLNIEMGWDSLTYHLRLPTFYIYRHKLYDVWHNYYAFFPSHMEMLFMLAQMAHGDIAARMLNASMGFLLLGAAYRTCKVLGAPPIGPLLVLACSPLFLLLATRCYVDLGAAFFIATSLLLLLRWHKSGSVPALLASGALIGWGAGCKLFVIVFWVAAALAAAPKFLKGDGRRQFILWNAALWPVFIPWLARNYLLRGNPVFPFFDYLLGLPSVRPADHIMPFEGLSAESSTVRTALSARLEAFAFDAGHIEGPMVPAFAGLMPLLAFVPAGTGSAFARRLIFIYSAVWIVIFPEMRFLLPVVPAALAISAGTLYRLTTVSHPSPKWRGPIIILSAFLGASFAASIQWRDFHPFSMALGLETATEKIRRTMTPPPYTGYLADYTRENVPEGSRILFLCHFTSYYVQRECLTDFHFGRAKITDILREGLTAEGIARQLRRRGIDWLLLTGTGAAHYASIPGFFDAPGESWQEWKRMLAERTETAWQNNHYTLFRVVPRHEPEHLPALPVLEALFFAGADKSLLQGQFEEAAAAYSNPPQILADVGSTWSRLGHALSGLGKADAAREAYERAIVLGDRRPRVLAGLAQSLLESGRPRRAGPIAEESWRLDPSSAQTAAILAGTYAALGAYGQALSRIGDAMRLDPGNPRYRAIRDRILARMSRKKAD